MDAVTAYFKRRQTALILVFAFVVVVVVRPCTAASIIPFPAPKWNIHVINGLKNDTLFVHCKSKDDDLGNHHLVGYGADYQWTFRVNFWGTTLFWCFLHKRKADVSFEAFWIEKDHVWLKYRCPEKVCYWTAKDDGIYLKNILGNVDELIHNWKTLG